jgi:acyl-homoserine lactone acylase PvdQ
MSRTRSLLSVVVATVCVAGALAAPAAAKDTARYILPPGNYGGLPFTENSTDQLPLYSGLTPFRDDITRQRINEHFLPEDFKPIGTTFEEETGREGTEIVYDQWGIPHITGETREDLAFGAGWVTARDRGLLLQLGRGPARAAVADIPNLDAFSLVTSAQTFEPSAATEALVTEQQELIVDEYGKKGREIIRDAQAYADGINAYWQANGIDEEPATVNDVFATTAFIGSIFGAGGGGEVANSNLLAQLRGRLGGERGHEAWEDVMLLDDPEAPTTIDQKFEYGPLTGGKVKGSVEIDAGSIQSTDPTTSDAEAAAAPARHRASNWLLTSPNRSATGNPLGVMGPQLGYYYPEIVQQMDLKGPGIKSQGAHVPGLAMYTLIGRTRDYAWSLTSAGHDVRDVYAEKLCEPDGSAPTRESTHYVYKGQCRPFQVFDAGLLNGDPVVFNRSVHGSVFATATVDGRPYAMARKRSTYGRDALNLVALHDMTGGKAKSAGKFWKTANNFGFTFNWAYVSREQTAFFSSGRLPERPAGLDRRLPTLGTGKYEWKGFLDLEEHPHAVGGKKGLLLNWNNRAAPGFMHGDDEPYGSVQRVELFDQWPEEARITDNVGIMNRAATEDVRSPVWPVVSEVLGSGGPAPSARDAQVVALLDDWVRRDAPRLDADLDGTFDEAGPTILDELWRPLATAVMEGRLGLEGAEEVNDVRSLSSASGHSYVDKDLRRLLGEEVRAPFNLSYCGRGKLAPCRAALWAAVSSTADALEAEFGTADPASWRGQASTTGFAPGLLSTRFPTTNRPTFQQVIELERP